MTCTSILMADPCSVQSKDLVRAVMKQLNLPPGTEVVEDEQYLWAKWLKSKSGGGTNYGFDGEWDY